MTWTIQLLRCMKLFLHPFWGIGAVIALFWLLHPAPLCAQSHIYTWTDEYGVTHFSDSVVSPEVMDKAKALTPSAKSSAQSSKNEDIPLMIFPDRPAQRFVHADLEGGLAVRDVLMLVDTGAQISLIDEGLAKDLDLEHIQDALLQGVTGASQGWIGRLSSLRLGSEEIRNLQVMVGPRPGMILLGMDVLERLKLSVGQRSLQRHE
jgi:predicted aspartyl protease